jgi:hypothetical protein
MKAGKWIPGRTARFILMSSFTGVRRRAAGGIGGSFDENADRRRGLLRMLMCRFDVIHCSEIGCARKSVSGTRVRPSAGWGYVV